jgi:hypothetical protein
LDLEHVFKAKTVTFWEVSRLFAKKAFMRGKQLFSVNSQFCAEFWIFREKLRFSGSGPPKDLPEACVYKGFRAGDPQSRIWDPEVHFGA